MGISQNAQGIEQTSGAIAYPEAQPQPYSYYSDVISRRNPFTIQNTIPQTEGAQALSSVDSNFNSLKLVGIVLSKDPQVVFEDSGTQETYFLRKGESIKGAQIKDILDGKVIFMNGQNMDLTQ